MALPFLASQIGIKRDFLASGAAATVNPATSKPARWSRRVRSATGRDPEFLRARLQEGDSFLEEITTQRRVMYEGGHP